MSGPGGSHPHELISAYLDGAVSESERRFVEAHLDACEACRNLLEDLRVLARAVPEVATPTVPDGLAEKIGARVDAAAPRRRARIRFAVPLAAAATLAAVALITTIQMHDRGPQHPPAPAADRLDIPPTLQEGKDLPRPIPPESNRPLADVREKGEPQARAKQNMAVRREATPAEPKPLTSEPVFAPAPAAPAPQPSRPDRSADERSRVSESRAAKVEPAFDKKKSDTAREVDGGVPGGAPGGVVGGVVGGIVGGAPAGVEGGVEAGEAGAAPEASPRGAPILSARAVSPRAAPACRSTWEVPENTRWEDAEPWRAQHDLSDLVVGLEGSYLGIPTDDGGAAAAIEVPRASFSALLDGLRKRGARVAVTAREVPSDADCVSMKVTIAPVVAPR